MKPSNLTTKEREAVDTLPGAATSVVDDNKPVTRAEVDKETQLLNNNPNSHSANT